MSEALAVTERTELERLESVIRSGLQTFVEVGHALQGIRDGRLYRETHKTFEAYCRERWSIARNYANKLIASAAVVDSLGTTVPAPRTERVARELATVQDPNERRKIWSGVVKTAPDGRPAASRVRQVVRRQQAILNASSVRSDAGDAKFKNKFEANCRWLERTAKVLGTLGSGDGLDRIIRLVDRAALKDLRDARDLTDRLIGALEAANPVEHSA